jgi:hypothetical protein
VKTAWDKPRVAARPHRAFYGVLAPLRICFSDPHAEHEPAGRITQDADIGIAESGQGFESENLEVAVKREDLVDSESKHHGGAQGIMEADLVIVISRHQVACGAFVLWFEIQDLNVGRS